MNIKEIIDIIIKSTISRIVVIIIGLYLTAQNFEKIRIFIFNVTLEQYQYGVIALLGLIIISFIFKSRRKAGAFIVASTGRRMPRYSRLTYDTKFFGVNWRILWGGNSPRWDEEYSFTTGPFCPECDYQLDIVRHGIRNKHHWRCVPCGSYFQCPPEGPYESQDIVNKWFESEVRSGRIKIPRT